MKTMTFLNTKNTYLRAHVCSRVNQTFCFGELPQDSAFVFSLLSKREGNGCQVVTLHFIEHKSQAFRSADVEGSAST